VILIQRFRSIGNGPGHVVLEDPVANLDPTRTGSEGEKGSVAGAPIGGVQVTDGNAVVDLDLGFRVEKIRLVDPNLRNRVAVIEKVREQTLVAGHGLGDFTTVDSRNGSHHHTLLRALHVLGSPNGDVSP